MEKLSSFLVIKDSAVMLHPAIDGNTIRNLKYWRQIRAYSAGKREKPEAWMTKRPAEGHTEVWPIQSRMHDSESSAVTWPELCLPGRAGWWPQGRVGPRKGPHKEQFCTRTGFCVFTGSCKGPAQGPAQGPARVFSLSVASLLFLWTQAKHFASSSMT